VTPVEFRGDLWYQKTRVPGLSCGVVCVILRLAVLVELRLVTDTDTGPWLVPRMHSIARSKSLQDPLAVGNNFPGINDNVLGTRPGTEMFSTLTEG